MSIDKCSHEFVKAIKEELRRLGKFLFSYYVFWTVPLIVVTAFGTSWLVASRKLELDVGSEQAKKFIDSICFIANNFTIIVTVIMVSLSVVTAVGILVKLFSKEAKSAYPKTTLFWVLSGVVAPIVLMVFMIIAIRQERVLYYLIFLVSYSCAFILWDLNMFQYSVVVGDDGDDGEIKKTSMQFLLRVDLPALLLTLILVLAVVGVKTQVEADDRLYLQHVASHLLPLGATLAQLFLTGLVSLLDTSELAERMGWFHD